MPVTLRPADVLSEEEIAAAMEQPVLTSAQLHQLREQIDQLRRINVVLRALKFRARTGRDSAVPPPPLEPRPSSGSGRGHGRGRGGSGGAGPMINLGGRGRGRGRGGKRGREDESEDDDSIVVRSSVEEDASLGSSGSDETSEGEEDTLGSSSEEESEEDFSLPVVDKPRQTARQRRATAAAAVVSAGASDDDNANGGSSSDGEGEGAAEEEQQQQQQQQTSAGPASQGAAAVGSPHAGKHATSGGEGGEAKRRSLFRVVSETGTSGAPLPLPALKPVKAFAGASEEDAVCSVCGDGEAPDGNVILLCEGKGCSVAVHQMCYGVHAVPEGRWLCDACNAKLKPSAANCCVCPVVGCAVKKVTELGRVVPAGRPKAGGPFSHLSCALWVPEIELADHENFAGVKLDKLTAVRVKLKCELCKQAGGGAVQCAFGTCCRSFHVLCGRAAGQQLHFRATDGEPLAFCGMHSKPTFAKLVDEMVEGKLALDAVPLE